jgi:hypothetical protein
MCPTCEGNQELDSEATTLSVAIDGARHSMLLQCGVCGQYFDYVPENHWVPWPLDDDQARAAYPGAVPLAGGGHVDDTGPRL